MQPVDLQTITANNKASENIILLSYGFISLFIYVTNYLLHSNVLLHVTIYNLQFNDSFWVSIYCQ